MRPAHLHFMITAPGYQDLITHIFADGDPHLGSDAVFGVRPSLIGDYASNPAGTAPDGSVREKGWVELKFDFVLGEPAASEFFLRSAEARQPAHQSVSDTGRA